MPEINDINSFIFDTAVIGAGPAGLSAAVRARFVKSRGAYPMSAIVFDSSIKPGGLANFSKTKLSGPSFCLERGELVSKLMKDIELFDIPVVRSSVAEIKRNRGGSLFTIKDSHGVKYTAKSVIIASGMRPLSNEFEYFGRGVEITYMGYDFINKMIKEFINDAAANDKKFMIYGNKYSINLINFVISAINGLRADYKKLSPLFLIDADERDIAADKIYKKYPFLFSFGKITGYSGSGRLSRIVVESGGALRSEKVDRVLIDYNSFELAPDFKIKISPAVSIFDRNGFIKSDAAGRTRAEGIFAAGDICGPYYSVSRAIAGGIAAAFSAYEFVTARLKKIGNYSLFAYRATNFRPGVNYREIAVELNSDKIAVLSKASGIKKLIAAEFKKLPKRELDKILCYFRQYGVLDAKDFEEISKILEISVMELSGLIELMIDEKLLSVY